MRLGRLDKRGVRGKGTSRLSRRERTEGSKGSGFVIDHGEEAVEFHDAEEVADDGLDMEEDDLALARIDATLETDEDGDSRAGEIIHPLEVDGDHRIRLILDEFVEGIAEGVVPEVVQAPSRLELHDQCVGLDASAEG